MYLGEKISYLEMYPNEAYVIVWDSRFLTGDELEKQLQKILRDLQVKTRSEAAVIISEVVGDAEKTGETVGTDTQNTGRTFWIWKPDCQH